NRDAAASEKAVRESLSWTEKEALASKLIDVVAVSSADLASKLHGREIRRPDGKTEKLDLAGAPIERNPMTRGENFFAKVLHPQIVGFLFMIAVIGIGFELTHPGAIFPGVAGAVSLLFALYAMSTLPVSFIGIALILLAIGLFV